MANVVRFTLPTAVNLDVPGVGSFVAGVLDVPANDTKIVERARFRLYSYQAVEVGIVDEATAKPTLPAVPGPPAPDPYSQYVLDTDLTTPTSAAMVALRGALVPRGALPGRAFLPARARGFGALPTAGTLPTVTLSAANAASTVTGGVVVPAAPRDAAGVLQPSRSPFFRYLSNEMVAAGTTFPLSDAIRGSLNNGQFISGGAWGVSILYDGTVFDARVRGTGGAYRIIVDGELVTPGTPGSRDTQAGFVLVAPADGQSYRITVTFPDARLRLIVIQTIGGDLYDFTREAIASFHRPVRPMIRAVWQGDSFTEPAFAGYGDVASRYLGWDDPVFLGQGGTGYLSGVDVPADGNNRPRFRRRNDKVLASNADIFVFAGGINDHDKGTKAEIQAEVTAVLGEIRTARPSAPIVAIGPFWRGGVETVPDTILTTNDAIRDAAASVGAIFIDILTAPLDNPLTGTLSAATTTGGTTFTSTTNFGVGSTVEINTGANRRRRVITAVSGSGTFTHTIKGTHGVAHSSGTTVTQVGATPWTGTGKVGATAGDGNSDRLVHNDGTHPADYPAHIWLGELIARRIIAVLERLALTA